MFCTEVDELGFKERHVPDQRPLYVNVYLIDRCYGGPEEGGWWFDRGFPVASIPFESDDRAGADKCAEQMRDRFPTTRERYSMAPRYDDHDVRIEREFAADFPVDRPRYE